MKEGKNDPAPVEKPSGVSEEDTTRLLEIVNKQNEAVKSERLKTLADLRRELQKVIDALNATGNSADHNALVRTGFLKAQDNLNKIISEIGAVDRPLGRGESLNKKEENAKILLAKMWAAVKGLGSEIKGGAATIPPSVEVREPVSTTIPAEAAMMDLDDAVRLKLLNVEQKGNVRMLLDNPEMFLDIVSKQFQGFRRLELFALRSNEAGYAEYEDDIKKKVDELRPQVLQGLEDLRALEAGERSPATAITLEKEIASLNAAFAAAESLFGDKQKFPALSVERTPEDAESIKKRNIYIEKINILRERHSTGLSRFYGSKWEKTKAFFGGEGPSPQKIVEQVTIDHPLLKPGERLVGLSPQELASRRKEFLKALHDKNFLSNEAESLYEAVLAKTEYQASLVKLGSSMMHSERQKSVKAMEKILGLPFDQWPADTKMEFEQDIALYKTRNVMDRVVIQEQQELLKAQAESLPPVEKGRIKRALDWYRGLSKPAKMAVSLGFGIIITAAGGGIGTIGAAGNYIGSRLFRSSIAMPAMFLIGKGYDFVVKKLGYSEKAEQKKNEALEKLRQEISPDNIAELQRAYGAIMEERAKTERKILIIKIGLTAASGFLLAARATPIWESFGGKLGEVADLSHGVETGGAAGAGMDQLNLKTPLQEILLSKDPQDIELVNRLRELSKIAGDSKGELVTSTDMPVGDYLVALTKRTLEHNPDFKNMSTEQIMSAVKNQLAGHGAESTGHEVIGMQPSHGLHEVHELYPSHGLNGSDLTVEVHQGDNLWNILHQKLEAHGAFKGLSTQEQNNMIAMLEKEADNPEMMKAIGIRADIDLIYPDQHLNLAPLLEHSRVPGVAEHFRGHSGVHETLTHEAVPPKTGIEDNVVAPKETSNVDLHEPDVVNAEHLPVEDRLPVDHPIAEDHPPGADRSGVDHRFDSIEPENFRGHFVSQESMARLWMLQHGGGHPPDSFMREAAEMRAHGILLKDTELFKSELRFRMGDSLEEIYGPKGIDSPDWDYWKKYGADDIIRMPDNEIGGPTAGNLRDYLRYLADNPKVEPPYTMGGRPETVEHFIARAEAVILDDELNAAGGNGFVPDNFSPRWYPRQGPGPSYYPQQHFYGGRGSNEHVWQRIRADHGSNEHVRQRIEADQGSNQHIRERLWADSGSNEHVRQRIEADQGSNQHIRQRMDADNN